MPPDVVSYIDKLLCRSSRNVSISNAIAKNGHIIATLESFSRGTGNADVGLRTVSIVQCILMLFFYHVACITLALRETLCFPGRWQGS